MFLVGRGVLTPYFMKTHHCIAYPLPPSLSLPTPTPLLFLFSSCFFGWMGGRATFDVLFYLILWIYTCASVPSYQKHFDVCFMQEGVVYWVLTHAVFCSDLISDTHTHTHTHTHKDTQHTPAIGASRLTHPYKYIYLHHLLCAHSSYLYYIE